MKLEDFFKHIYIQTKIVRVDDRQIVMKCYNSSSSFKWYFISPLFRNYPYTSDPKERMDRELDFFTYRWSKINVPKVIDFDYDNLCLYREFIEGNEIIDEDQFEKLGESIRYIHDNNYVLGDTKLENFIVKEGKISVIDAEQAIRSNNNSYMAWDLLVLFFSLSYNYLNDPKKFSTTIERILYGYNPSKEITKELMSIKAVNLLSLIPFFHYNNFRKVIEKFL
ncbi:lipopolysaccharide core heptose(II) kinase RfaY [Sulfolobaceae archaeon RB850M]|nr:lipopolysaccharide core heptose(II) kinase RfaY [Sulfolobaceae archaeon]